MSTYFPSIPQGVDNPTDSQDLILNNFESLNTTIDRNHTPLSDVSTAGKHKFLQMPQQTDAPSTGADEGGLYTKDVSGSTQLFYREESDGAERQLTGSFIANTQGTAELAGGLLIQWGTQSNVTVADDVKFTKKFNGIPFNIQISQIRPNNSVRSFWIAAGSITDEKFNIQTTDTAGQTVVWFAIGI